MKNYFLCVDTETTQNNLVADFAATITDKQGNIVAQCAVLVAGVYGEHPLFFDSTAPPNSVWSAKGKDNREQVYNTMLDSGTRMLASVPAINSWLLKACHQYNPVLTAYNLAFDVDKCGKTGIDLNPFIKRFCLWHAACNVLGKSKAYRKYVLENHLFNAPTERGNMTYKVNAETVSAFINGVYDVEPHTALEDIIFHELPILQYILKRRSVKRLLDGIPSYNWRDYQVKDNFRI